jgi:hypothetical protein
MNALHVKLSVIAYALSFSVFTITKLTTRYPVAPRFEDYGRERIHEYLDLCLETGSVPKLVWTFWFGGKEMSTNRSKALSTIEERLKVPVILLTDTNITEFLRWPVPIYVHFLSGNHRSDYFRIYFMYYYGGGYSDVKHMGDPWDVLYKIFDEDPNTWIVGVPEIPGGMAWPHGVYELPKNPAELEQKLISNGFMIARPKNPYQGEVHKLVTENLHKRADALVAHPPPDRGRCCFAGQDPQGYPFRWAEFMGELMAYVGQKYFSHLCRVMKLPPIGAYL